MTRKDYVALASALNVIPPGSLIADDIGAVNLHREIVARISDVLAFDNPRFDRERFLKAAGVQ